MEHRHQRRRTHISYNMICLLYDNEGGGVSQCDSLPMDVRKHGVAWTDSRLLSACAAIRREFGGNMGARLAFCRPCEGIHGRVGGRYFGYTVILGELLERERRERLRALCLSSGLFAHVAIECVAPAWVECSIVYGADARLPSLYPGAAGCPVLALQDCLLALGFGRVALTGVYDAQTRAAVKELRWRCGLESSDCVDDVLWNRMLLECINARAARDAGV
ncbi:MAG: peptidoglycan-binding domain-containing protein [Clostridia bacterium]|nr:peptidoglycan-binding domain-containing protein [Clostridia bacterium]